MNGFLLKAKPYGGGSENIPLLHVLQRVTIQLCKLGTNSCNGSGLNTREMSENHYSFYIVAHVLSEHKQYR